LNWAATSIAIVVVGVNFWARAELGRAMEGYQVSFGRALRAAEQKAANCLR